MVASLVPAGAPWVSGAAAAAARLPIATTGVCVVTLGCASPALVTVPAQVDCFQSSSLNEGTVTSPASVLALVCAAAAAARLPITTTGVCGVTLGCAPLALVPARVDHFQISSLGTSEVASPAAVLSLVCSAAAAARLPIATTGMCGFTLGCVLLAQVPACGARLLAHVHTVYRMRCYPSPNWTVHVRRPRLSALQLG
jgi:hypothetical protein